MGPAGRPLPGGPLPRTARVPGPTPRYQRGDPRAPPRQFGGLGRHGHGALDDLHFDGMSLGDLSGDEFDSDDESLSWDSDDDRLAGFPRDRLLLTSAERRASQREIRQTVMEMDRAQEHMMRMNARARDGQLTTLSGYRGAGRRNIERIRSLSRHANLEYGRDGPVRGGIFRPQRGHGHFGPGGMRQGHGVSGMGGFPGGERLGDGDIEDFESSSEEELRGLSGRQPRVGPGRLAPRGVFRSPESHHGGW